MGHHGGVASETAANTADTTGTTGTTGTTDTPGDAGARPSRRPKLKTARDMLLSMAVICVGAFGLYVFVPHDASKDSVPQPVEYEVAAATAARAAPYELLVPHGLSDGWRATSVAYESQGQFGATWRLGFVNPDDEYAALAQGDGDAGGLIAHITRQADPTGATTRVEGQEWERYEGPKYDALVLREPQVTTIVFGTAPFDALAHLAASLDRPS
jgi:hypothetical protein